jgi:putative FmdB family regulatory protein
VIYTYECKKCGDFDHFQNSYRSIGSCPTCNRKVRKIPALTNFQLVGEGWTSTAQFNDKVVRIEKELLVQEQAEDREYKKKRSKLLKKLI